MKTYILPTHTNRLQPGQFILGPTNGPHRNMIEGVVESVTRRDRSHYYILEITDIEGNTAKYQFGKTTGWTIKD